MVKFSEIIQLSDSERSAVINDLTDEEIADLIDQRPYSTKAFTEEPDHIYFDDAKELHKYLLHNVVPAAKPWRADEIVGHEFAHAQCAIALGAVGVQYSVSLDRELGSPAFTYFQTTTPLPNLAFASIAMNPFDAARSNVDRLRIKESGYISREQVAQRIERWNNQQNDLRIPSLRQEPRLFRPN